MARRSPNSAKELRNSGTPELRRGGEIPLFPMLLSAAGAAIVTAALFFAAGKRTPQNSPPASTPMPAILGSAPPSLDACVFPPAPSADADPAVLNLLCAPGLSPSEREDCLTTLEQMTAAVRAATAGNYHRFVANPKEFGSEVEWRMAMMTTVLGQDFRVRYDPAFSSPEKMTASNRAFFGDPARVFLSGALGPARTGTCASLPVLYVAIGRRLGYPMFLVPAKNHLFARWDDGKGIRVNLEAANTGGFTTHPDSHYRAWPFPISPAEEKARGYLGNLDSSGMLAVFLGNRAQCLMAVGKNRDAAIAAAGAYRLAPELAGSTECLQAVTGLALANGGELADLINENQRLRNTLINRLGPPDPSPYLPAPAFPIPGAPNPVPGRPIHPGIPYQPNIPTP